MSIFNKALFKIFIISFLNSDKSKNAKNNNLLKIMKNFHWKILFIYNCILKAI